MDLMQRGLPLPIHPPTPPDRWLCHQYHGTIPIVPLDCQTAIDRNWGDGRSFVRYFMKDPRPSSAESIPSFAYSGTCRVAIEPAGPPEHFPHSVLLRPRELRGLAGYLIERCPADNNGIGGFLTLGLGGALSYIHNPSNESWSGNFLTISIQPRIHRHRNMNHLEPGSHNANIAWILSGHAASLGRALGSTGTKWYYDSIAIDLHKRAIEMQGNYDPDLTWWSKSGVWSWWAARNIPFSRPDTAATPERNWTLGATGQLGDEESLGDPPTNVSSIAFSSDDGGDDDAESGKRGPSDGTGSQEGEMQEGDGVTSGNGGDEATSPLRDDNPQEYGGPAAGSNVDASDMTYQCDDSLGGGPDPVDCEKLSWSGLKPPGSIETLQPGVPTFYTQGTCALGISSVAPTTILWTHLIAAFETLNMICVQNPISRVKGGRAYFGKQAVSSWINGKVRRDARNSTSNRSEALPQGINATIFKHDLKSQLACEWTLAGEGKNLSSCSIE